MLFLDIRRSSLRLPPSRPTGFEDRSENQESPTCRFTVQDRPRIDVATSELRLLCLFSRPGRGGASRAEHLQTSAGLAAWLAACRWQHR